MLQLFSERADEATVGRPVGRAECESSVGVRTLWQSDNAHQGSLRPLVRPHGNGTSNVSVAQFDS